MFHSLLTTDVFVVVLGDAKASSETMLALGQSGFIGPGSFGFDSHFMDQLIIFKTYEHKPMQLFINIQLMEQRRRSQEVMYER